MQRERSARDRSSGSSVSTEPSVAGPSFSARSIWILRNEKPFTRSERDGCGKRDFRGLARVAARRVASRHACGKHESRRGTD